MDQLRFQNDGRGSWNVLYNDEPYLDKRANDTQACKAKVLKGARLAVCVQQGVEKQRNLCCLKGLGGGRRWGEKELSGVQPLP